MNGLPPRLSRLEWSQQAAANQLEGVRWVEGSLSARRPMYRLVRGEDSRLRYHHIPYVRYLPAPMVDAVAEAQAAGVVTLQEALVLLFGRVEWTVATRGYLWSPLSAYPKILARVVEAFGIDPLLHKHNPEALSRLAAILPAWHPFRGSVRRAREVIEAISEEPSRFIAISVEEEGPVPPALQQEVFCCRSLSFWEARRYARRSPVYRISGGFLHFQPEGGAFSLRKEDVLVQWKRGEQLPQALFRLLPPWKVIRLVVVP